jgi:release factor glutamine methyltransferase
MNPTGSKPRTLREWARYGAWFLADHGVPNARNNAEWMLCHVLGCERIDLYTRQAEVGGWEQRYRGLLARRAKREPLQYIVGTTEFMSLVFETPAGVFVPRPETEALVEAAERRLRDRPIDSRLHVLDLCCGAGVVAVSLAARIPNLTAVAVDTSAAAAVATRANAARNGVGNRVRAVRADAAAVLERGEYAAVVANPPYIESREVDNLPPEVRDHEPRRALDGGPDGLDFYRRVVPLLRDGLRGGGFAAFEIGDTQGPGVAALLEDAGFTGVTVVADFSGRPRVVVAG